MSAWYRWLTFLAIGLPVLGAVLGAVCGWSAFRVSDRIGDLQTADLRQAQQTIAALKSRRIAAEQEKQLRDELRSFSSGKVSFDYRLMDGESEDFARQLAAIFYSAGWSIGGIGGSSLNDLTGKVTVAIDHDSSNADFSKTADRLCSALTRAGIPCGGDLKPNSLWRVGRTQHHLNSRR